MKSVLFILCLMKLLLFNCDSHIFIKKPKSLIELHIHLPLYVVQYPPPYHTTPQTSENYNQVLHPNLLQFNSMVQPNSYAPIEEVSNRDDLYPKPFLPDSTLHDSSRYDSSRYPSKHDPSQLEQLKNERRNQYERPKNEQIQTERSQYEPLQVKMQKSDAPPQLESSHSVSPGKEFVPTKHPNWKLVNSEHCGVNVENRIVGGVDASLGQFPWMARVGYKNVTSKIISHKCGGVLISHKFVVTAAHCVMNLPLDLVMYVGALYNYTKDWISPICLPFGSLLQKNLTGSRVDIAGWGLYESISAKESIILQTVKLPVMNTSVCVKKFKRYKVDEMKQLCVGGEIGKDSCSGDSGGPLMKVEAEGQDGPRYYLFGIVSFGATFCGLNTNPAIYTRVVHYLEWILDSMDN